ncbi:MAG TPA: hypothetical protein VHC97_27025 [Thermoanaerobaculia bacterium]|nr:hypothetical protein [Thermoanaerobaculia bacterium]
MKSVPVKNLALDLANYRTVRQNDEISAVEAMISTSPDRFWALMDSLLKDGYLPTENIIVLRSDASKLTVKEGNRRVAALKLIHGLLPLEKLPVPDEIAQRVNQISSVWLKANKNAPCTIYDAADAFIVDRIVTLAHGKGEKASRDQWNAVARARHNRDANAVSEPALDLLEQYLVKGKNLTQAQAARWAGNYPLSVLAEAMKRLAPRLGLKTSPVLASQYPAVKHREALEMILHDIGQDRLGFEEIRRKEPDFTSRYGLPVDSKPKPGESPGNGGAAGGTGGPNPGGGTTGGGGSTPGVPSKPKAVSINDPKAIRKILKGFAPRGKNREKVVTLKIEAERLDVAKTPIAFCFLLRSMFEISAKAYCKDHATTGGPSAQKKDGKDKSLADLLRDITKHLTGNNSDIEMTKALHGAMAELGSKDSFLSVTSMNQLVHNPKFSVAPSHVATLFGNIFPLLEAMNN